MEVNSDALVAARERIKELEALVAVLTEKIKVCAVGHFGADDSSAIPRSQYR